MTEAATAAIFLLFAIGMALAWAGLSFLYLFLVAWLKPRGRDAWRH